MPAHPSSRNGERGFTLVELLIVIVVLGILSGIVLFGVARFRGDAALAACKADLATVAVAADAYDAQTGGFPTGIDVLVGGQYLKSVPSGTYAFDAATKTVSRTPACSGGTGSTSGTSGTSGAPTGTPGATASTGRFTGATGACVDLANLSGDDATAVQLATCNGSAGQQWVPPASYPGAVKVLGKCLDVNGGGRDNNTRVQLYQCNNSGAQVWTLRSDGTLLNPQSARCLSTNATTPLGTQLFVFDCGTAANQRWTLG